VGLLLPNARGYEGWVWTVGDKPVPHGKFLGDVVNFLIVAASLFLFIVEFLGWVMRAKKAEDPPP
jgi:large conductance mechanosensitive channel